MMSRTDQKPRLLRIHFQGLHDDAKVDDHEEAHQQKDAQATCEVALLSWIGFRV